MDINRYRSDIQEIINEVQSLRGADPEKTLEKCDILLKYGEDHRDDALIGFAGFTKGETYYLMNDMPSFYLEMLKCMAPFEKIREWGYLAAVYNMLGIMSLNRGNAPMAMDYYFKAYEYCEENKLPDIKCMVHMNIAGLYLYTEKFEEALEHFDSSYKYLINHMDTDSYIEKLTAVLVGKGKAFLGQGNFEEAENMKNEIDMKCRSFLKDADMLVVNCFEAALFHKTGKEAECKEEIVKICEEFNKTVPIMDVFDDIYDFLSLLLELKAYNEFLSMTEKLKEPIGTTMVKNLEKKIMELMLKYLRNTGNTEAFHALSEKYIDLVSAMENENKMMISSMVALRNDFYKLKEENKEEIRRGRLLKKKSETDPLTGMANRLKLNDYGETIFERAITNNVGFAIELLDIDYFKEYNDNYGHQAGDECLLFIAKSIMSLASRHPGIFCARYGGDEFVIIYESFSEKEVFELAKELKTTIVDAAKEHEYAKGNEKFVTISQGIYWGVPEDKDNIWEFLHEADNLLYKVKKKSRNSVMLGRAKTGEEAEKHEHEKIATRPLITEVKEEEYLPAED